MSNLNLENNTSNNGKSKFFGIFVLQIAVLIHALSGVFSKLASGNAFFSWEFLIPFGVSLFFTFLYALLWQIALKKMTLMTAFLGKSIGTVWMAVFGVIIFHETLTLNKLIGLILVVIGSFWVVTKDE